MLSLKLAALLRTLVWQTLLSLGGQVLIQLVLEVVDHVLHLVHALVLPLVLLATDLTILLAGGSHHSPAPRVLSLNHLMRSGGGAQRGLVLLWCCWVGPS